jgi:AbrB family looped-hinge helix DNA binding protein
MGKTSPGPGRGEQLTLKVDDRGRVTLPKRIREQLGIEPNDELRASLVGSVLEVNPKPSSKLETATAGRDEDEWAGSTPMDAGETLFGPSNDESH